MYRDSFLYDLVTDFVPFGTFVLSLFLFVFALVAGGSYVFGPPSCKAYGEKMQIETSWGFWTSCMINVQGQWLPWSDVVPVERNGKIVFVPKPEVRLNAPEPKL